jgi:FkbM family methyltransferase
MMLQMTRSAARAVPKPVRSFLRSAHDYRRLGGVRRGESFASYRRLVDPDASDGQVAIAIRELGGESVCVRLGSADRWTLECTFSKGTKYHLPPASVENPRVIWDLGANIGLTMVHFAHLFPQAHIVGIELESGNATLCRANVEPWNGRCEVIEAAVWTEDGVVGYDASEQDEQSFRIAPVAGTPANAEAAAVSLNSLLERTPGEAVDFVKMDIEGAERDVLRVNTEWSAHVRAINVEAHPPYSVKECAGDLERLGFDAEIPDNDSIVVLGTRR